MNPGQTQSSSTSTQLGGPVHGSVPNGTNKRVLIIITAILVLVFALVAGVLVYRRNTVQGMPCTNDPELMERAAAALAIEDETITDRVGDVVREITALPNYDTDPNCLYPVFQNQIVIGDVETAKAYFAKLEQAYEQGNQVSAAVYGTTMDTIRAQVEFLDVIMQEAANNATMLGGFGLPPEAEAGEAAEGNE